MNRSVLSGIKTWGDSQVFYTVQLHDKTWTANLLNGFKNDPARNLSKTASVSLAQIKTLIKHGFILSLCININKFLNTV